MIDPSQSARTVRIGGACGFWGDSGVGAPQLARSGLIDYLVFDYLAETTMAILAAARAKKPELGYATDFVDVAMKSVLADVTRQRIKVVSNAGGIHPEACASALARLADSMGLAPKIAVVTGDDVSARMPALREAGARDMFSGQSLPGRVLSANAYLGALPIAQALAAGADIVITGRCVDSAVTLGPLIHEFGWRADDFDRLAGGSLAGHVIECGCQATGGLFTDWEQVPDWPNIGYPIVECASDGSFTLGKPPGTGGLIARGPVAEQLLYEIGDPGAYLLPDVTCDFRAVRIEPADAPDGEARVRVSGARGRAPSGAYKVSATTLQGFRCAGTLVIIGIDAAAKARRTAEAILARTRRVFAESGWPDYTATRIEVLGAESLYGPHARTGAAREVMMRLVVDHPHKPALELFAREVAPAGTSWSPGTTGPGGGRPSVSPLIKPFAFLLDKATVPVGVLIDGARAEVAVPSFETSAEVAVPSFEASADAAVPSFPASADVTEPSHEAGAAGPATPPPAAWVDPDQPMVDIPLIRLAWARSGDKGNLSNIGVIARRPEWLPLIWDRVTPEVVRAWFAHLVRGKVERFHLPGIAAVNYLLHDALDGGGPASMRLDPLGKGMAQMLLELPVRVPRSVADGVGDR